MGARRDRIIAMLGARKVDPADIADAVCEQGGEPSDDATHSVWREIDETACALGYVYNPGSHCYVLSKGAV